MATSGTSFGRLLLVVFCAPLYFFLRGRLVAGIVHSVLYLLALLTLIVGIGVFFWFASVAHAAWDFAHVRQNDLIQKHAAAIAESLSATQRPHDEPAKRNLVRT